MIRNIREIIRETITKIADIYSKMLIMAKGAIENLRGFGWMHLCPELGVPMVAESEVRFRGGGKPHTHPDQTQVIVMLSGSMSLTIEAAGTYELEPGHRCVVPAGREHVAQPHQTNRVVRFVDIRIANEPTTPMLAYARSCKDEPFSPGSPGDLDAPLRALERLKPFGPRPPMSWLASALWSLMGIYEKTPKAEGNQTEPAQAVDPRVAAAERLIRESLSRPLGIQDLAEAVHLSPSHLRQLYIEAFGEPPARRIRRLRVEQAGYFLEAGVMSIGEVAQACGFQNASHFSSVFQAVAGVRPSKYRMHPNTARRPEQQ